MVGSSWERRRAVLLAPVIAVLLGTAAHAEGISKAEYNAAWHRAAADGKAARARCDELSGNRKNVCVAEARADETRRRAEAEAAYRNDDKGTRDARLAIADADYRVAKARCAARTGNEKKVCLAEADAARRKAKADAEAAKKVDEVRRDVAEERRDADYDVAIQRCNLLGGASKDACVGDAKVKFHK